MLYEVVLVIWGIVGALLAYILGEFIYWYHTDTEEDEYGH